VGRKEEEKRKTLALQGRVRSGCGCPRAKGEEKLRSAGEERERVTITGNLIGKSSAWKTKIVKKEGVEGGEQIEEMKRRSEAA